MRPQDICCSNCEHCSKKETGTTFCELHQVYLTVNYIHESNYFTCAGKDFKQKTTNPDEDSDKTEIKATPRWNNVWGNPGKLFEQMTVLATPNNIVDDTDDNYDDEYDEEDYEGIYSSEVDPPIQIDIETLPIGSSETIVKIFNDLENADYSNRFDEWVWDALLAYSVTVHSATGRSDDADARQELVDALETILSNMLAWYDLRVDWNLSPELIELHKHLINRGLEIAEEIEKTYHERRDDDPTAMFSGYLESHVVFNANIRPMSAKRHAEPISREEFERLLRERFRLDEEYYSDLEDDSFSSALDPMFVELDINVDSENANSTEFRTLSNGVTVLMLDVGGDWQFPVKAAVYYDGEHFRIYVPKLGNAFNLNNLSALNDDEDSDLQFVNQYGFRANNTHELYTDLYECTIPNYLINKDLVYTLDPNV